MARETVTSRCTPLQSLHRTNTSMEEAPAPTNKYGQLKIKPKPKVAQDQKYFDSADWAMGQAQQKNLPHKIDPTCPEPKTPLIKKWSMREDRAPSTPVIHEETEAKDRID
ncbi:hypothetical protein BSKO_13002 [Bryopsis sp. KO-2023]|nr:hypothetical protein BSKO_13002 [Bryopsis sp. KO-2023]